MANQDVKKGVFFFLYYNAGTDEVPDWKPFARAATNSFNFGNGDIDVSNKSTGDWEDMLSGRKNWTTDIDGFIYNGDDIDEFTYMQITTMDYFMVQFGFSDNTDKKNPVLNTNKYFTGCVKASNSTVDFNDNDGVKFSMSLTGKGAYEVIDNTVIGWSASRTGTGVQFLMTETLAGATPTKEDIIILDDGGKLIAVADDSDVVISTNVVTVTVTLTSSVVYGVRLSKKLGFTTSKTIVQKFQNVIG